ncbi:hypothetical protein [Kutzneria kofuensis]|uniref:Uncharacterized protein n=1 Tax=Kutzneria kofuensis TaxID=103725 RepID=A0A7W9KCG0_9PSEU|nr:hypothetical protein [Kutzneria kofuensis]MBB5890042.1 hypothetical protein [Kutzneria kofuensis]
MSDPAHRLGGTARSREIVPPRPIAPGEYGEAFNKLDGRRPFIETEEREELFDALDHAVSQAAGDRDLAWARERLAAGVDSVRDW